MAIGLTIDNQKVIKWLNNIVNKLKDAEKARDKAYGDAIGTVVFQDVNDHFKEEKGSKGKWPIWSINYADAVNGRAFWRTIRGNPVRFDVEDGYDMPKPPRKPGLILQDTGRLRNSIKPTSWRKKTDGYEWYNNAKTKGNYPYAAGHNYGDGNLPQREFMWLSDKAMTKISKMTLAFALGDKL